MKTQRKWRTVAVNKASASRRARNGPMTQELKKFNSDNVLVTVGGCLCGDVGHGAGRGLHRHLTRGYDESAKRLRGCSRSDHQSL